MNLKKLRLFYGGKSIVMKVINFLQIEPTTRCNFCCKFCCGRYIEQRDISLLQFEYIINSFPEIKHIELQGEGEPLLHKDFFKMLEITKDKGIKVSTITNGSLLTSETIENILKSDIETMNISIEWPTDEEFHKFRGGNLERIKNGIKELIDKRNERGLEKPAIGFSVTILKDTIHLFDKILEIYHSLRMDGGIHTQILNKRDVYARYYDDYINSQILSDEDELKFKEKYSSALKELEDSKRYDNYYDELFKVQRVPEYYLKGYSMSCHLVENSLFIDSKGYVSCCVMVKDPTLYSYGKIDSVPISELNEAREEMSRMISIGKIPVNCEGCINATEIYDRLSATVEYKPYIKSGTSIEDVLNRVREEKEEIDDKELDLQMIYKNILDRCTGEKTCSEIINELSKIFDVRYERLVDMIIPKIDELVCNQLLRINSVSKSDYKEISNFEPFNEVWYKSCFYASQFPILYHFTGEILPFILDEIFLYEYEVINDVPVLYYGTDNFSSNIKAVSDMGMYLNFIIESSNIVGDLINSISNECPVILFIDCFYASNRPDVYKKDHAGHVITVYGYDCTKRIFKILDHSSMDSIMYEKSFMGFDDIEKAYNYYTANMNVRKNPSYHEYSKVRDVPENQVKEYVMKYAESILDNMQLFEQSLLNVSDFIKDIVRLAGSGRLLSINFGALLDGLTKVLNNKRSEAYIINKGFGYDESLDRYQKSIISNWSAIRAILSKIKLSSSINQKAVEVISSKMADIYKDECSYCTALINHIKKWRRENIVKFC
jgi:MoaA/NifB/PqqE/SkfB family radical SAM enzyme